MEENPPSLVYEPLVYVDRHTTERELTSGDEQLVARAAACRFA